MSTQELNSSVVFYTKAYKKALRYWYTLVVVCAIISVYFLLSQLPFHDYSSLVFSLRYIGVIIFSLAKFYRSWRMTRLVLNPWGVEYYGVNFQLTSSWDDLSLAKNRSIVALFSPVRLTMKKPVVKRNLWFNWDLDVLFGNARYFIPLDPRLWDGYNELVELIKLRRPDLFLEQTSE
jgi:hypothetical protein